MPVFTALTLGITAGSIGLLAGGPALQIAGGAASAKSAKQAKRLNQLATLQELEKEREGREEQLGQNEVLEGASGLGGESQFRLRLKNITSSLADEKRIRLGGAIRDKQIRTQATAAKIQAASGALDSLLTTGLTVAKVAGA